MGNFIVPMNFDSAVNKTFFDVEAKANTEQGTSLPFQDLLSDLVNETSELMEVTEQDNYNLAIGNTDNLAQMQLNSLKASTMLETTVQLTSRVVNAYKEIMQIQI